MSNRILSTVTLAALAALTLPLAAQKGGGFGGGSMPGGGNTAKPAITVVKQFGNNGKERNVRRDARAFRQLKVPGTKVKANVTKLTRGMRWHGTVSGALAAGRNAGKPVLFVQALGELDGFL